MLTDDQTIPLAEISLAGQAGNTWNRLHEEREEICKALMEDTSDISTDDRELLQARLRKIDDELDRLICKYEETKKQAEPKGDLNFDDLKPFDMITLHTRNSDYRIMVLDPDTGRALVEGGSYLLEPSEALVRGSAFQGLPFKDRTIDVGSRLEMWVDERIFITSPIQSLEVHSP